MENRIVKPPKPFLASKFWYYLLHYRFSGPAATYNKRMDLGRSYPDWLKCINNGYISQFDFSDKIDNAYTSVAESINNSASPLAIATYAHLES
jgi:hypothetical protein